MKRLGFSLMEMMIVLLIVAIVAAASAPMISKKMIRSAGSESPWVWTGLKNSIAYNLESNADQSAIIGSVIADSFDVDNAKKFPRLFITSKFAGTGTNKIVVPHITMKYDDTNDTNDTKINVTTADKSIVMNDKTFSPEDVTGCVAIGYGVQEGKNSVAIGAGIDSSVSAGANSVAIGLNAKAEGSNSIALGGLTSTMEYSTNAIAIGTFATAGNDAIAIGVGDDITRDRKYPKASANSIAIGKNAWAPSENSVVIGTDAKLGDISGGYTHGIAIGPGARADGGCYAIGGRAFRLQENVSSGTLAVGPIEARNGSIAIGLDDSDQDSDGYLNSRINRAIGNRSIAIGLGAQATASRSIAIGKRAFATHDNSVALGKDTSTIAANQIVIGNADTTVYIPGHLAVGGVIGGTSSSSEKTFIANKYYVTSHPNTGLIGTWRNMTSDRRLKNVGETFKGGLEELKKLELFHYTFKKDPNKTPHVGVMAQDLQKVFPNAVFKGEDGFLRIRMEDMFYAVINAIKELDTKICELFDKQKRIDELEKEVKELRSEVNELKKDFANIEKKIKKLDK